jgi:import receptor subunit TOM22
MPSFEIEEEEPTLTLGHHRGGGGGASSAPAPSFLSRVSRITAKLLFSTGRAAWVTGTTLLVLVVPLIIEMDREQQLTEMESQQMSVLAGGGGGGGGGGAPAGGAVVPAK